MDQCFVLNVNGSIVEALLFSMLVLKLKKYFTISFHGQFLLKDLASIMCGMRMDLIQKKFVGIVFVNFVECGFFLFYVSAS